MSPLVLFAVYCIPSIVCMAFINGLMRDDKDEHKLYYLLVFIAGFLWPLWLIAYCYGWIINN